MLAKWKEEEKTSYVLNYWVAVIYAALGGRDAAFAELEKAYQAHDWFMHLLEVDPFIDPARRPALQGFVKTMNLPELIVLS